jgi:hypothetical protein
VSSADGGADAAPRKTALRARGAVLRDRRALGAVAAVILIALVVLISGSGGEAAIPPATGAASVVPGDALAYIHFSTDASRSEVTSALALAARFPGYPRLRDTVLAQLLATGLFAGADFKRQIRPWLGKDAAIALLGTSAPTAAPLLVVGVSNRPAAARYLAGLPSDFTLSYQGTTITGHPHHTGDTAFIGHYLLIGHRSSIRAAIDVAAGRSPALSRDPVYRRAASSEPPGRAVDAYLSATGVTRLLIPRRGLVGAIAGLVYQPSLQGVAVSLTPAPGGVEVLVHSVLNPQLAHSASASFTPSLASSVPAGAALFLDASRLDQILPRVLPTIGIGGRIPELLKRLGAALKAEGIDVAQYIAPLFRRESAVVISTHGATPVITVITHTPDPNQTRTTFAQLETALAQLLGGAGTAAVQAPVFNQVTVGGVTAHQLVLPGLQFDYAVFGGNLVLSTSLQGIAGVARHAPSIDGEPAYGTTLGNHPARVTSLLFLDLNQLLSLGEHTGLMTGARFSALKPDLQQVRAIGLDSTSGEAQSTTELFLRIP